VFPSLPLRHDELSLHFDVVGRQGDQVGDSVTRKGDSSFGRSLEHADPFDQLGVGALDLVIRNRARRRVAGMIPGECAGTESAEYQGNRDRPHSGHLLLLHSVSGLATQCFFLAGHADGSVAIVWSELVGRVVLGSDADQARHRILCRLGQLFASVLAGLDVTVAVLLGMGCDGNEAAKGRDQHGDGKTWPQMTTSLLPVLHSEPLPSGRRRRTTKDRAPCDRRSP
jgi:hypothetical protein